MPRKNIDDIYQLIYDMLEDLESLETKANDLITAVSSYGGDIRRVIQEQMSKYFIPYISKIKSDESVPGCIKSLITFLDSIELWQTRIEPSQADYQPDPEVMQNADPDLPASTSVDQTQNIPQNASYQTGMNESYEKYRVVRKTGGSELGGEVANLEDSTIGEYNTEEEASQHCQILNDMVSPEEKSVLGTEYEVKKVVFEDGEVKVK